MGRYVITVNILRDEILVDVSRNGKFYDEASFTIGEEYAELNEFVSYIRELTDQIAREIRKKLWGD